MSDDTFIFKESPMKLIRRLLWAGAFVAMGVFLLLHGDTEGWYAVGFFGLCALVLILRLIRGGIILKADSSGIKIKTLYGLKKFNWSDVNGFYVRNIHDAKMIHIE